MAAIGFVVLTVAVAALFWRAVRATAPPPPAADRQGSIVFVLVIAGWIVIPAILASGGVLDRYNPLPAPALLMVLVIAVATVALAFSRFGARLARGLPLWALVGFQAFRIPVEILLHALYVDGVLPVQMTYAGLNFDIATGLSAAALGLYLRAGNGTRTWVAIWNIVGLALLINIVTIAVLSTPVPFRHFANDPPNLLPSTFPYVWLPTFLVQAALFGHLLVFRALAANRASVAPSVARQH
jgi:hypothetical protein